MGDYPVFGSGGVMRYVNEYLYDKPSILLPRKGSLNNIQYCDVPFWTVDTLYYTEVNEKIACPYYLYNYLCLLDLSGLDTGTGVPSMTFDSYYNIKVLIPEIEEQKRVASVLQNLDHKIALNRQINDNLCASRAQRQTQFELCRGAAVNADISQNLLTLDRSLRGARVRLAA